MKEMVCLYMFLKESWLYRVWLVNFQNVCLCFCLNTLNAEWFWIRATTGALGTHSQVIISAFLTSYYFFVDSTFTNYKISANRFSVEILFFHTVILVNWLVCRAKYFTVLYPNIDFQWDLIHYVGLLCWCYYFIFLFLFFTVWVG